VSQSTTSAERLRLHIEAVERLEDEKKSISGDIAERYSLAKAEGFDTKVMKQIVKLRRLLPDDRRETDMVLDTYRSALGLD
jgi:uncharacterized protein (UPF0335 family)